MNAILGRKKEMTQIFDPETGKLIPVTLVDSSDCVVVGKKTKEKDGYDALKLGLGYRKKTNKPEAGKYKSVEKVPAIVKEVQNNGEDVEIGTKVSAEILALGDKVSVTGTSKGKGFAGVVKRWGFHGTGSRTHGQSNKPRHPGSIGAGTTPGRVYKGRKMGGRMGNDRVSIKNVKVVFLDTDSNLIGLKGMVPGAKNSLLILTK